MPYLSDMLRFISSTVHRSLIMLLAVMYYSSLSAQEKSGIEQATEGIDLNLATRLAAYPLKCVDRPFPYKTGVVFGDSTLITVPSNYHPAFFGCFDWHSSVHGHWMLARLLRRFPALPQAAHIRDVFDRHLTEANIQQELLVLKSPENKGFERTYGWAWLLMLQRELDGWQDPAAKRWSRALRPFSDTIVSYTRKYLKALRYPIRTGEHNNLAFGLAFIRDYGVSVGDTALTGDIDRAALRFYANDKDCPLGWEPSGSDFLSPCLEEADLMSRVLKGQDYVTWLKSFMPGIFRKDFTMETGQVLDRSDGKLVHLDGLNLSRAWCLRTIGRRTNQAAIIKLADAHLNEGLDKLASGDYAGEHWLASFAVYALTEQ